MKKNTIGEQASLAAAEIRNALYLVRYYARPASRDRQAAALEQLARILARELERADPPAIAEILELLVGGLAPDDEARSAALFDYRSAGRRR